MKQKSSWIFVLAGTLICLLNVGCGDRSKDTQSKVDAANADLDRMGKIDRELSDKQFFITSLSKSRQKINQSDLQEINEIDRLLNEFISRGNNVVSTARRSDVLYPEEKTQMIEAWVRLATNIRSEIAARKNQLRATGAPVSNFDSDPRDSRGARAQSASNENCPAQDGFMAATSIPQGAAYRYVQSLGSAVTSQVDWRYGSVETSRVKGANCNLFQSRFKDRSGQCVLNVIMNYDTVLTQKSDRAFRCP